MSTRAKVERFERTVGHPETWVLDLSERRDPGEPAFCERVPVTKHGERLTRAEFDALPPNPRRVLVTIENEGEGEP